LASVEKASRCAGISSALQARWGLYGKPMRASNDKVLASAQGNPSKPSTGAGWRAVWLQTGRQQSTNLPIDFDLKKEQNA